MPKNRKNFHCPPFPLHSSLLWIWYFFYQFLFYISTYICASMNEIQFVVLSKLLYKRNSIQSLCYWLLCMIFCFHFFILNLFFNRWKIVLQNRVGFCQISTWISQKIWNASQICMSSMCGGHANFLCIVPILVYVLPKRAPAGNIWQCLKTFLSETTREGNDATGIQCIETSMTLSACVCAQSCLTLCNPVDCKPAGFLCSWDFQATILERVAIPFSRWSSQHRDRTCISWDSCISRQILYHWATRDAAKHPTMYRTAPYNKDLSGPKCQRCWG